MYTLLQHVFIRGSDWIQVLL